jgi:hypothetical protein
LLGIGNISAAVVSYRVEAVKDRVSITILLNNPYECFDGLSMNGKFLTLSIPSPFVPSINSGRALRLS